MRFLRFANGRRIDVVDDEGNPLYALRDGVPIGFDERLTIEEREERPALLRKALDASALEKALAAQDDPRFSDARSHIISTLDPSEAMEVDRNAHAFNRVYSRAREVVGPSEVELAEESRRQERLAELEAKIAAAGEGRHPTTQSMDDLAELLVLKGGAR